MSDHYYPEIGCPICGGTADPDKLAALVDDLIAMADDAESGESIDIVALTDENSRPSCRPRLVRVGGL